MIFLINASTSPPYHIWLPFYIFNGHEYRNPIFAVFLVLEFFISVLCIVMTFKLSVYIWRVRVFHVNMSVLAIAYICQYVECFVGKTLITLHQNGFFPIDGVPGNKKYLQWWTDDKELIPTISSPHQALPLFIGGFLIWHYIYSMIFFIFSFCVERALATILSGNYEKHNRSFISFSILLISHTLTLYNSFLTFYAQFEFIPAIVTCVTGLTLSCLLFVAILLMNMKIHRVQSSDRSNQFYTLSCRFQVKENIKALKLAYRVVVCIGAYMLLNLFILIMIVFNFIPSLEELLTFIMENCIHLNPLLVIPVITFSIEPWHKELVREVPTLGRVTKCSKPASSNYKTGMGTRQTTDSYFNQLHNSWSGTKQ